MALGALDVVVRVAAVVDLAFGGVMAVVPGRVLQTQAGGVRHRASCRHRGRCPGGGWSALRWWWPGW